MSAPDMRVKRVVAPVRQQVYDQLKAAIVTRQFGDGERLTERELTALTGVSRPTVREALQQLAAEGLVSTAPGRGWIVASLTFEEVRDLYAVRAVLEGLAGRRFVERCTDADVRALQRSFAGVESALGANRDVAAMLRAKAKFYEVLFRGAGSTTIGTLINALHARIGALRARTLAQPGRSEQSIDEIRQIMEAVAARDPVAAEEACARHVARAAEVLLASAGMEGREST